MTLILWYAVLAVVQVALASWVILAQPRRVLNWAVGCLLILSAGAALMVQLWREAVIFEDRLLYARTGYVYQAPTFFLTLLVIDRLLLPTPRPRGWRGVLVAGGVLTPFFALLQDDGVHWYTTLPSMLSVTLEYSAQTGAVLLAIHAATDPGRSAHQRRQAALVGFAFALLLAHLGASGLGNLLWGQPWGDYIVDGKLTFSFLNKAHFTLLGAIGLAAALYGAVRIPAPFRRPGRVAMRTTLLLLVVVGLGSYASIGGFSVVGGRAVALSAFSVTLAVAIFRYDLATAGTGARRRLGAISGWVLALCVLALLAVAGWSLRDQGAAVLSLALAAVIVPSALFMTPLKRFPAWVTRVLLQEGDADALRERVRVYTTTLRAATGPDGRVPPAAEPALATLREQLGVSKRDHDLLLAMGTDPGTRSLVAYHLALASSDRPDEARLQALRAELGLTDREHALVVEHLDASAATLAPGALFLGRYHVARRLGEGGLSEVWLARDVREERDVVLKRVAGADRRDALALRSMRREVLAASAVEHPHVVQLFGVETLGDDAFLVMEHMPGGSLAERIRARGSLPEAEVIAIASGLLDALGALHARGFVHRDVKPANVLFDAKGSAKLGDFNVARELVSGDTLGEGGARGPVGTFAYMPPEQARGLRATPASDLYSVGATLLEALTGEPLRRLEGLSHTEAVARIAQGDPPAAIRGASPRVSAAIVRALARLPEDRFASADAMRAAIIPAGRP